MYSLCTAACVMCTQGPSRLVFLVRSWICGPNASLPRHIPGTDQPLTLTPPDSESPLAAESAPIDASGLYKIAHSVDGNGWCWGAASSVGSGHPTITAWSSTLCVER